MDFDNLQGNYRTIYKLKVLHSSDQSTKTREHCLSQKRLVRFFDPKFLLLEVLLTDPQSCNFQQLGLEPFLKQEVFFKLSLQNLYIQYKIMCSFKPTPLLFLCVCTPLLEEKEKSTIKILSKKWNFAYRFCLVFCYVYIS